MRRSIFVLAFASLVTLGFSPRAEARFGKADPDDSRKSSPSSSHQASPAAPAPHSTHQASPLDARPHSGHCAEPAREAHHPAPLPPAVIVDVRPGPGVEVEPTYVAYEPPPPVYVPAPPPPPVIVEAPPSVAPARRSVDLDLRLDLQGFRSGGAAGGRLLLEGTSLGLDVGLTGIVARADDGTGELDGIGLLDVSLTWAPVSGERGRLRIEGGLAMAFAPSMIAAAPQLGLSGEVRIVGPLGIEGSVRGVAWPYRSVDWHAALQLTFGVFNLRAGVRQVWLDDAGLVGTPHTDNFLGPWVGVGVRL